MDYPTAQYDGPPETIEHSQSNRPSDDLHAACSGTLSERDDLVAPSTSARYREYYRDPELSHRFPLWTLASGVIAAETMFDISMKLDSQRKAKLNSSTEFEPGA
jgi:hypothetical protein